MAQTKQCLVHNYVFKLSYFIFFEILIELSLKYMLSKYGTAPNSVFSFRNVA
jgi:hypothetical protein